MSLSRDHFLRTVLPRRACRRRRVCRRDPPRTPNASLISSPDCLAPVVRFTSFPSISNTIVGKLPTFASAGTFADSTFRVATLSFLDILQNSFQAFSFASQCGHPSIQYRMTTFPCFPGCVSLRFILSVHLENGVCPDFETGPRCNVDR